MQNQLTFTPPQTNITSLVPFLIPAGIITFGLFVGMHHLIDNKQIARAKSEPSPIISLRYQEEEPKIIEREPLKPKPEPKPQPKLAVKIEPVDTNNKWSPGLLVNTLRVPTIKNNINTHYATQSGDARPIVRIEPKYPSSAARDGIQGWVKLSFSVSTVGLVENIQIIDAEPKRVFNNAAKRALSKWKYKPNIVQGQPRQQDGMTVMLDFKLGSI